MRRMFDSLFARVLGVQLLLALAITVLLATVALRQQNQEMARHIAPLWAAAHPNTPRCAMKAPAARCPTTGNAARSFLSARC